jgi:hypothetical protein
MTKWLLSLVFAFALGGCCQPELWAHVLFGTELREIRRAAPEPNISAPETALVPVEKVQEILEPIRESDEMIAGKVDEIETDIDAIK